MSIESSPRADLVRILRQHGPLDSAAIARLYGARVQSVRPQLDWLQANHYVEVESVRAGVGRPRHRYRLTARADEMFPKDYRELVVELVESAATQGEVELVRNVFQRRDFRLESEIRPFLLGRSLEEKLEVICQALTRRGFMASFNPTDGGFLIEARNCPVSAVAEVTDVPCNCERDMIGRLLGGKVVVESVKRLPLDDELCTYAVIPSEPIAESTDN